MVDTEQLVWKIGYEAAKDGKLFIPSFSKCMRDKTLKQWTKRYLEGARQYFEDENDEKGLVQLEESLDSRLRAFIKPAEVGAI